MIGVIAGDIIASSFRDYPVGDVSQRYFPLFETRSKIEYTGEGRRRQARIREFPSVRTSFSDYALAVDAYLNGRDYGSGNLLNGIEGAPSFVDMLSVCGPVVQMMPDEAQAQALLRNVFTAGRFIQGDNQVYLSAYVHALYLAKTGGSVEQMEKVFTDAGLDVNRNSQTMNLYLTGFVMNDETGHAVPGSQKTTRSAKEVLPAALIIFRESDSYEDAVRRAAALGGDSSLTASLVGAMAELRWGVPEHIRNRVEMEYLSENDKVVLERYERNVKEASQGEVESQEEEEGLMLSVIHMEGMSPVYLVPAGIPSREEILDALEVMHNGRGSTYQVVSGSVEFSDRYHDMLVQRNAEGEPLYGSYISRPSPEIRHIWFQEHELRGPRTRKGLSYYHEDGERQELTSPQHRMKVFREWMELKAYIEDVRKKIDAMVLSSEELQKLPEGYHVVPGNAFYPEVLGHTGVLREGEVERLRFGVNDDGRFYVDNLSKGGFHGEGIQGILDTMNLVNKNANMKDVRMAIDYYVMDEGKTVYTEEEREALKHGDEGEVYSRVEGINTLHASNLDKVYESTKMELQMAVMPVTGRKTIQETALQEERRADSVARYEGVSSIRAVDNRNVYKGSVFTFGLGKTSLARFNQLMTDYGITHVVDIRSFAFSKFNKDFNPDKLEEYVKDAMGMEYIQAKAFGEAQTVGTGKNERVLTFDEVAVSEDFKHNLKVVREMVRSGDRIAFISNDSTLVKSHRMLLVGRALQSPETYGSRAQSVDVMHIQPGGKCISQTEAEGYLLKAYGYDVSVPDGKSINVFYTADQHPELSNFASRSFTLVVPKNDARGQISRNGLLPVAKVKKLLSGGFRSVSDAEKATGIPASMLREAKFSCVEQYYQYAKGFFCPVSRGKKDGSLTAADKTLLLKVQEKASLIMSAKDPSVMKGTGKEYPGLDTVTWNDVRGDVMYSGMKASFDPNVNKVSWSVLDKTGDYEITHLQADSVTAGLFSDTLMRVRKEYREEGYGKTYKKSEMVSPDPPLKSKKSVLIAAYSSGERAMRAQRTDSGRGVSLTRNKMQQEYRRKNAYKAKGR